MRLGTFYHDTEKCLQKKSARVRVTDSPTRAPCKNKGVPPNKQATSLYGGPSACHEMHNEKNEADDEQNVE